MQGKGVSNHLSAELQSSDPPSAGSLLQHLSKICEEYTGNKCRSKDSLNGSKSLVNKYNNDRTTTDNVGSRGTT